MPKHSHPDSWNCSGCCHWVPAASFTGAALAPLGYSCPPICMLCPFEGKEEPTRSVCQMRGLEFEFPDKNRTEVKGFCRPDNTFPYLHEKVSVSSPHKAAQVLGTAGAFPVCCRRESFISQLFGTMRLRKCKLLYRVLGNSS